MKPTRFLSRGAAMALISGIGVLAVAALFLLPPLPQDPLYHNFADSRPIWGINNFMDVASNGPFILVGLFGMIYLARGKGTFVYPSERAAFWIIFGGVFLTGFGSAYYHENPGNATLFWDRLPLTLVFMAFFSVMIMERVGQQVGLALLVPLLLFGAGSMIWWRLFDDLRFYALVQFYPLMAIPLMLSFYPARYTRTIDIIVVLGGYGVAKAFEMTDRVVFDLLAQQVSGHTIKHLVAGIAGVWFIALLQKRRPVPNTSEN